MVQGVGANGRRMLPGLGGKGQSALHRFIQSVQSLKPVYKDNIMKTFIQSATMFVAVVLMFAGILPLFAADLQMFSNVQLEKSSKRWG